MTERDEDRLWRDIVDNYGDRAELGEEPAAPETPDAGAAPPPTTFKYFPPPAPRPMEVEEPERFVPPDPPPVRYPRGRALAAWLGVIGAPVVLVVCLLGSLRPPPVLAYALVAWFVGGFVYLVLQLPRSPREPWDDGAQL